MALDFLTDPAIRHGLRQAWIDSNPGAKGGHEEGGFIVRERGGGFRILRWSKGRKKEIVVPDHTNCKIGNEEIVASFHTHPNTGGDYSQKPSWLDCQNIRSDPHLKGSHYVGELVLSQKVIYLIKPDGGVMKLGEPQVVIGIAGGEV
jgi:hypothetical protein